MIKILIPNTKATRKLLKSDPGPALASLLRIIANDLEHGKSIGTITAWDDKTTVLGTWKYTGPDPLQAY